MTGTYFVHAHRPISSLHAVLQARQWLENDSGWPVDDLGKKYESLTGGLAHVEVRLSDCSPRDSPKQ